MPTPLNKLTDFVGLTKTRQGDAALVAKPAFVPEGDRTILFEWNTVTRPQIAVLSAPKLNRSFVVIGGFIALLLILMHEFLLIAAIGSIVFLWYALSASPVEQVNHKITNHGVEYAGQFYGWNELSKYFFTKTGSMDSLCIDTVDRLPGRLFFMINQADKETIKEIVGKYLIYLEEEPRTFADKWYEKAIGKISFNKE